MPFVIHRRSDHRVAAVDDEDEDMSVPVAQPSSSAQLQSSSLSLPTLSTTRTRLDPNDKRIVNLRDPVQEKEVDEGDELEVKLEEDTGPQNMSRDPLEPDVFAPGDKPAPLPTVKTVKPVDVDKHNVTHFPHQPWCPICVQARSKAGYHQDRSNTDVIDKNS